MQSQRSKAHTWHWVWHRGASQTGSHTWSHTGASQLGSRKTKGGGVSVSVSDVGRQERNRCPNDTNETAKTEECATKLQAQTSTKGRTGKREEIQYAPPLADRVAVAGLDNGTCRRL